MAYVVKNEGSWVLFTKSNYLLNRALLNQGLGVFSFFPSIGTPTLHKPIHVLDEILENKNELEKQENLI